LNKIFVHCNLPEIEVESLEKYFELKIHSSKNIILNEKIFFKKAKGYNGVISQGNIVNKRFIDSNKKCLRVISNVGVGYDNIDIEAASKNGIAVFNTPNLMKHAVADLTLGLLVAVTRKICLGNNYVKEKKWKGNSWDLFWGDSLQGERLGIIGLGNIGKEVALRAKPFGCEVFYNNRTKLDSSIEKKYKVKYLEFNELISSCKFIVLLLPLTKSSKYLISKKQFNQMRKDTFIINVARGKIIKEIDLINALRQNIIAGAALDVFENEPKVEKKLLNLDNVVLMPHAGSATRNARLQMMKMACNNLKNYLLKGSIENLVNSDFR